MFSNREMLGRLTSRHLSEVDRDRILNDFAYELGWRPSDHLDIAEVRGFANAHLMVEHGLENTALITFISEPRAYSGLSLSERSALLNVSYNNLVDWHIHIDYKKVNVVYNRVDPPKVVHDESIREGSFDSLTLQAFEEIAGKRPNPNVPSLDSALIKTISDWKRRLAVSLDPETLDQSVSALFNSIILARAAEDYQNRRLRNQETDARHEEALLKAWNEADSDDNIGRIIGDTLESVIGEPPPETLYTEEALSSFDDLDYDAGLSIINDFYRNRYAPIYKYDFSIISKHALSRIYEHYVSELDYEARQQTSLFPEAPQERKKRSQGSYYSPQYVANFFAKFLKERVPPKTFRNLKSIDPACGSGIFLRSLLEMQSDPTQPGVTTQRIDTIFEAVNGVDIDKNASHATRLSLSLLYLVLTGRLPQDLNVENAEALVYFAERPELQETYDVVVTNPPYIKTSDLSRAARRQVSEFLGPLARGRIDMYMAFLKLGVDLLRPGGYGMFVLPAPFLTTRSASKLREYLQEKCWIHLVADLSPIQVFQNAGIYVILLVFQKKPEYSTPPPSAIILKCQEFAGHALQDVVEGRVDVDGDYYSIFEAQQEQFENDEWLILPPGEANLEEKFKRLPKLGDFMEVRQGFNSGNDDVFVVFKEQIPKEEADIFVPVLPDQQMEEYRTPASTDEYLFYPYLNGERLSAQDLQERFPETWKYLLSRKEELEERRSVMRGTVKWWRPERPRPPKNMMRPKIVSPHLVLVPKFSIDVDGEYAIGRSPLIFPKELPSAPGGEDDFLLFFLAVLNSSPCYWWIENHSSVYQNSYILLERNVLKDAPVPDPTALPAPDRKKLLQLVEERLAADGRAAIQFEEEIDKLAASMYALNSKEKEIVGVT